MRSQRREPVRVEWVSRSELTKVGMLIHGGSAVPTVRRRACIVRMSHEELACGDIADLTGAALSTVTRVIRAFNERRMKAVYGRQRSGRPCKVGEAELETTLSLLDRCPSDLGHPAKRWSLPLLADQLESETGIRLSPDHLSRWLASNSVVWKVAKCGPPGNRIRVANPCRLRPDRYKPGYTERDLRRGLHRFIRALHRQLVRVSHKWFKGTLPVIPTHVWIDRTQSGYERSPAHFEFHAPKREIMRLARGDRPAARNAAERLSKVVRLAMLQQCAAELSAQGTLDYREAFEEAVALVARNVGTRRSRARKAAGLSQPVTRG